MQTGGKGTAPVGKREGHYPGDRDGPSVRAAAPTATEDSAAVRAHLVRAIRGLLAAPRILNMYPAGHRRIDAHLAGLTGMFDGLFDILREPCSITAHDMKLEVNGKPLAGAKELGERLAYLLRRRRIGTLTLYPGLTRTEIHQLAQLLASDQRQFLREGDIEAWLAGHEFPHIAAEALRNPGTAADLASLGVPPDILPILETDEIGERLEGVRRILGDIDPSGSATPDGDIQALLAGFLDHIEWEGKSEEEVRQTFDGLVDRLEEGLWEVFESGEDADTIAGRIAAFKSRFQGSPDSDAAAGSDSAPSTLDYSVEDVLELGAYIETDGVLEALQRRQASHDAEENALLVLGDVLLAATDAEEYRSSREAFLAAVQKHSSALLLHHLVVEMPILPFEETTVFVRSVIAATDEEEIHWLLATLQEPPAALDLVLEELAAGRDPFASFARALSQPLSAAIRDAVCARLTALAAERPDELRLWASRFPDSFLESVCVPMLEQGPDLLAGACREILLHGERRDRKGLVAILREHGSEPALRLLLEGVPVDGEPCDSFLLEAIATSRDPLAVDALADIVRRGNDEARIDEAASALRMLRRIGSPPAMDFLREVVSSRRVLLPRFSGKLRSYARALLEGGRL